MMGQMMYFMPIMFFWITLGLPVGPDALLVGVQSAEHDPAVLRHRMGRPGRLVPVPEREQPTPVTVPMTAAEIDLTTKVRTRLTGR